MHKSFFAAFLLLICTVMTAQQALNNDSIIKLVKAGLSDDLILSTINASNGTYDTSANGLIALKHAGASDRIVQAIVLRSSGNSVSAGSTGQQPGPQETAAKPPAFHSTDGKIRIFVTDHPISEFNSMSKGFSSTSHSQTGDDPRTVEIQADIIKTCPAFVMASNNPDRADYILVFRRRGGERSSMFAFGGLSGLALSAAAKINGGSLFEPNGDMVFASKENTVEKTIKEIYSHIPAPMPR